jgi:hypothetical protein
MTNNEKSKDDMKLRMEQYERKLKTTFEAKSADLTAALRDVDSQLIIDPENEDPDFYEDFARVVDKQCSDQAC